MEDAAPEFCNLLSDCDVSYELFLLLNARKVPLYLDSQGAITAVRSGAVSSPFSVVLGLLVPVFILASIVMPIWYPVYFSLFPIFLSFVSLKASRALTVKNTWKELKGEGKLNVENRKELYRILVKNGFLWSNDARVFLAASGFV